ncbi:polycystin-1-like protein 2 [Montipora foliosa]|uniref:polycystin-1-like protein 2 n=1 Tax=Montipora foliosa TaxID=591990 RepID=UPI0035F1433E
MSCCLAVAGIMSLIATILVDSTQNVFPEESIRLGPWKFRLGDIYRAIVCAGIAFAVRLLLEFLFKNSRRKRPLQDNDMDVSEHIQDYFQRLNAIEFVDDNKEMNMVQNDSSNAHSGEKILDTSENSVNKGATTTTDPAANENVSIDLFEDSIKKSIDYSDESSSMKSYNEASELSHDGADYASADESISGVTSGYGAHTDDFESSLGNKEKKHLMKTKDIRELIDVLGNVPEKEILIDILDNDIDVAEYVDNNVEDKQEEQSDKCDVLSLEGDDLRLEFPGPEDDASYCSDADNVNEAISTDRTKGTVIWSEQITNPDKIPELWKQLPFPHQLIDEYGIKKPPCGTPRFPYIVLRITRAQCFIVPVLCTIITTVVGLRWSGSVATSWVTTFVVALTGQIFVLETLHSLLQAMYFATWSQRPVGEEDLINELSKKVWVNDDEELAYYADTVVDDKEEESVPMPPTEEDIQVAQKLAGRDRELEDVIKMLAFDVLFLLLLTLISFGNRDGFSYPSRDGMYKTFNITEGFSDKVKNTDTFWSWLMNDTIPVLLFDPLDKTPNEGRRHFLTDGYTYLLGTAILRQQRLQPGLSCDFGDLPQHVLSECHQVFLTEDNKDTKNYHPGWKATGPSYNTEDLSPWKYSSGEESGTDYSAWGRTSSHDGGGYIAYLSSERQTTLEQLKSLKSNGWIDQLTRVVFLEFSTYNANVNILSALVFSTEIFSYGGALPYFDMYSFRLFRYYTAFQFLYLVCEVIFVVFVVQLINRVGHQVHRDRWIYFTSFWNFTDLLLISFSLVNIALYAVRSINLTSAIEAIREDPNAFYGFLSVAFYDELIAYISCIIFVIPCLQFLKFLKFNKNFMIFYATLERIRSDICGFGFVFLVSMLSFTYWSHSMLKTVAEPFSTFLGTFYSMISLLLGKFSFRLLSPGQAIAAQVGPLFTYSFTCANVFFILNIILAIITIGFAEAQSDERFQESEYEVVKFIINYIKERLGLLPPYIPPPPKIGPPKKEKHYTYFQWKLCTRYVTRSQFPRLMRYARSTYLDDFVDELEIVAKVLNLQMSRQVLEEMIRREHSSEIKYDP